MKITLATIPVPAAQGVRVTGRTKDTEVRSVYLSGTAGTLYSDGTFEFQGVVPGRYNVAALGNPPAISSLAASIVVGDRDMEGVELQVTPALPLEVRQPAAPEPVAEHASSSVLPLPSIRGRLIEEASGKPIEEGSVKLIGRDQAEAQIGVGGQFEFLKLLPGNYNLEIRIFGHSNVLQPIAIGDEDLRVDVTTLRMY